MTCQRSLGVSFDSSRGPRARPKKQKEGTTYGSTDLISVVEEGLAQGGHLVRGEGDVEGQIATVSEGCNQGGVRGV
jgi:hypothetical protein